LASIDLLIGVGGLLLVVDKGIEAHGLFSNGGVSLLEQSPRDMVLNLLGDAILKSISLSPVSISLKRPPDDD